MLSPRAQCALYPHKIRAAIRAPICPGRWVQSRSGRRGESIQDVSHVVGLVWTDVRLEVGEGGHAGSEHERMGYHRCVGRDNAMRCKVLMRFARSSAPARSRWATTPEEDTTCREWAFDQVSQVRKTGGFSVREKEGNPH